MVMNDISHEWARFRRAGSTVFPAVHFKFAEEQILLWEASAQDYLRNRASCRDNNQRLLHDVFQVFVNFFIFQLHRHQVTSTLSFTTGLQMTATSPVTPGASQDATDNHNSICMDRCETMLHLFLSLRRSYYGVNRVWILVHIALSCSFFVASMLKKNKADNGEDPEQESDKIRWQVLRDLTEHFEQSIPYTVHPHHMDILKALKGVIGMP